MSIIELLSQLTLPDGVDVPTGPLTIRELADLLDAGGQGSETVTIGLHASVSVGEPSFAARLRTVRLQRGLSQPELSAQSGLHIQTIRQYETGRRLPTDEALAKLASVLGQI